MDPSWVAESDLGDLVYVLTMARRRRNAFHRRPALSARLGVTVSTLSDWEAGRDAPTLLHLIRWALMFDLRLVICGEDGDYPLPELGDEAYEARRLLHALGDIRRGLSVTQLRLSERLGVTETTIHRWEHALRHPRMLSLMRWAHELGCVIQLRSLNLS
ncbi:transcriptional regulator with XRE-family HTH domain [Catenulispora sp. GAS73]|uniref:helix-turn-helix domain-containing protein n=1 Tax=Catenulispora sp. GAS73 TaxID=3156269 RepID=UPI0035191FBF